MYFKNRKHRHSWRFHWHSIFAFIILLALFILFIALLATSADDNSIIRQGLIKTTIALLWAGGLYAVFAGLLLLYEVVESLKINREKLDNLVEMQSRGNNLLLGISQAVRLSDTAKEIVYRDSEQMELAEAILTKLHQHDFNDAETMITAMSEQPKYQELAQRLKIKAEKYHSATEDGRINQIIAHITDLFDQRFWIQASAQIDTLIQSFPYSEKAKSMPAQLQARKDRHKRELLADWDQAIRNKETDRGLEILKELDLYLTPSEALALQESASSVFKTKLHNLGVEFSVAVTEQDWKKASQTGKEIVQNFPNSRMAAEIRSKMDILQERAGKEQKFISSENKKTEQ